MPSILRNLVVTRGSLVDAPANKGAHVALFKRRGAVADALPADSHPVVKATAAAFDRVAKDVGNAPRTFNEIIDTQAVCSEMWKAWNRFEDSARSIIASDAKDKAELLKRSADEFNAFLESAAPKWAAGETLSKGDSMSKTTPAKLADSVRKALSPEVQAYIDQVEKAAAPSADKAAETVTKADHDAALAAKDAEIAALKGVKTGGAETEDDVLKALPEPLRKRFQENERIAKEATDLAKAERDQRVTRDFIEKARGFDQLPAKVEDLGPILKRAAENALTDADRTEIDRVLKAANELLRKSQVFKEIGRAGAAPDGSAWSQIEGVAGELRKSDTKLTHEQAIAKVLKDPAHRELVAAYRAEAN